MVFLVFVLGVKSDFEVNLSGQIHLTFLRFRVCLVGGRIGWMENNREKMGLCVLWLGGGKRKYFFLQQLILLRNNIILYFFFVFIGK